MKIVGIMGAEQAGKSTLAAALKEHGFQTVTLAGPLKRMLAAGFPALTHEHLYGNRKEEPVLCLGGNSTRYAMQKLGTEYGRAMLYDDVWVDLGEEELRAMERESPGGRYVFEDVRFVNEIDMVRRLGGEIWLVRRPEVEPSFTWQARLKRFLFGKWLHKSQTEWSRMDGPDVRLWNTEGRDAYVGAIASAISDWKTSHGIEDAPPAPVTNPQPYDVLREDAPYASEAEETVRVELPVPLMSATMDVLLGESDGARDPLVEGSRSVAQAIADKADTALLEQVIEADLSGEQLKLEHPVVPTALAASAEEAAILSNLADTIAQPSPTTASIVSVTEAESAAKLKLGKKNRRKSGKKA